MSMPIDPVFRQVLVLLAGATLLVLCSVTAWIVAAILRRRSRKEILEMPQQETQSHWRVAALIAVLPIYFALSYAPVLIFAVRTENKELVQAVQAVYRPIDILCEHSDTASDLRERQIYWWGRLLIQTGLLRVPDR